MSTASSLSPDFIASQRTRLEALRSEMTISEDTHAAEEAGADTRGEAREYEEGAQELDRKEVLQSRHEVDLHRMANIERALAKIDAGTYGLSDRSGKPIPKARLEATPEATLTVEEAAADE